MPRTLQLIPLPYHPSRPLSSALALAELLVKVVHAVALAHPAKLRNVDAELLDGLHLLAKVLALHKVAKLRVVVCVCDRMELQKLLEVQLLKRQRELHGVQRVSLGIVTELAHRAHQATEHHLAAAQ